MNDTLAVAIMTLLVLFVFIVPLALAISTLLEAADASPAVINDFLTHGLGPPPAWAAMAAPRTTCATRRHSCYSATGPSYPSSSMRGCATSFRV